jgi:hypothetical protein
MPAGYKTPLTLPLRVISDGRQNRSAIRAGTANGHRRHG